MTTIYRADTIGSLLRPAYLKEARQRGTLALCRRTNSSGSKIAPLMKRLPSKKGLGSKS